MLLTDDPEEACSAVVAAYEAQTAVGRGHADV
jgi:hypothetical protein